MYDETIYQIEEILRVWHERGYHCDGAYVVKQAVSRMYRIVIGIDTGSIPAKSEQLFGKSGLVLPPTSVAVAKQLKSQ
ncbi:MAG: hypothetical protein J5986_11370 [Roseburia sp.]|nr:hypothetical protein [Roseburia sp.]